MFPTRSVKYLLIAGLVMDVRAQEIRLTPIAAGIDGPTDIQSAYDGTGRLFFVQQNGLVRVFRNGAVDSQPFLDIRSKTRADGERGLLGLAFPPGFAQKRRFYVDYTDLNGDTVIAQYRVPAASETADAASETVLLQIAQPFANHNGGQLRFGPDGYLYVGMGDGGSSGDPRGNGQKPERAAGQTIAAGRGERSRPRSDSRRDNPTRNVAGARPEIWAIQPPKPMEVLVRSGDGGSVDCGCGPVGAYEEIDYQPAASRGGENYGWNLMEGAHCFTAGCATQGLTLPVAEYPHTDGCSVTGGFLYRGTVRRDCAAPTSTRTIAADASGESIDPEVKG